MDVNHGFDSPSCSGGNSLMSMAYLSRFSGPINEGDAPTALVRKHVQRVDYIPGTQYTFNEIKQAVMTYGAVETSMGWYDSAYKSSNHSYYYNGKSVVNHGVAIVGWDDNYSKSNFIKTPSNDGAFIIRNSWGNDWGEGGYFYMSYYDTYAGYNCWAFDDAQAPTNYSTIYQYDPLGWVGNMGSTKPSSTEWGANIFTATSSEPLQSVSFYASSINMTYKIDIYSNVAAGKPTSGTLADTQSGILSNVGYITIPLNQQVPLTTGALFSVVVKFVTPGYDYPLPVQYPLANYSSKAIYYPGESFASDDGQSWDEISNSDYQCIACIKAFGALTSTPVPSPSPSPTPNINISLTGPGWNLISLPIQPSNTAISNVLASISGIYSSAWAFQNGSWKSYDPANPGFSDLSTLTTGYGYWLNMTGATTLSVTGAVPSKIVNLITGWNLVGYNSSTSQNITNALSSITGNVISVWAYKNNSWQFYDPANPGFSELTTMSPGFGYWINTTGACTWTLP